MYTSTPMSSAIHLFTGTNAFALQEKKRIWIDGFAQKHGNENLARIDGSKLKIGSLLDEIAVAPFIAEKRLIIVDSIPKFSKEEVGMLFDQIHPDVLLLFVDPKPDKRLGGTKELLAKAQKEEFPELKGVQLQRWMQERFALHGVQIDSQAEDALLKRLGEDQALLAQEIDKLSLFCEGRTVTKEDIALLVMCCSEQQVWGLMDALATGNPIAVLGYVRQLLEQGESVHGLWNILLWMCAQLTLVSSAVEDGVRSPPAIVKSAGASFGAAKSLVLVVTRLGSSGVKNAIKRVVRYDHALKTGALKATDQESAELHVAIDRVLMSLISPQSA